MVEVRHRRATRSFGHVLGAVVIAIALVPGVALANDTAVAGPATELVPLNTSKVRMKSEDIRAVASGQRNRPKVRYRLRAKTR
jgi:hypothetical protein